MSSPEVVPEADDAAAQAALAEAAANAQEAESAEPEESGLDPKVAAKLSKANREAKALRERVKELEPLKAELDKIRDGQKSELQRAQDKLAEAEAQVKTMTIAAYRNAALLSAGLSSEFAEYISADTEEGARVQAENLAKHLNPEPKNKPKGAVDLRQGQRGSAPAGTVDKNDLIRRMAGFA